MTTSDGHPFAADREQFLAKLEDPDFQDTAIALSWRRSLDVLGDPSVVTDVPQVPEEMLDAHLLDLLHAPLARFSDSLHGTGVGVLLADADGRILQRWTSDDSAAVHLDQFGTMRGAVLAEDVVGTNGVGTVAATGRRIQVSGEEHFADFYSSAVCTGSPVRHPITGKLLAVVTLSTEVTPRADLLWPLLTSVTNQLEQHVLEVEQPAVRRLFHTFLAVSRQQRDPVVAFGPQGLFVQNSQAGKLSPADVSLLHELTSERTAPGGARHVVDLSTGAARVHVNDVGNSGSVVVVLDHEAGVRAHATTSGRSTGAARTAANGEPGNAPAAARPVLVGRAPEWLDVVHDVGRMRDSGAVGVVAGEAGTGKMSVALGRPARALGAADAEVVDASEAHVLGTRKWLQKVGDRLRTGAPLAVRGVDTLDTRSLDGLRSLIESHPDRGSVLLTLTAATPEDAANVALRFDARVVWVPALRERSSDIAPLWLAMAVAVAPSAPLGLHDNALRQLRAYRWPGNVRELRSIVSHLAGRQRTGQVLASDLPDALQGASSLTLIERMEVDAIRNALQEADGNRARAAEILGLSRATVYRKMKAYRLTST